MPTSAAAIPLSSAIGYEAPAEKIFNDFLVACLLGEEFINLVVLGAELGVEGVAIGHVKGLRHAGERCAFAFAGRQSIGATERAEEIGIDIRIGQLHGAGSGGVTGECCRCCGDLAGGVEHYFGHEPLWIVMAVESAIGFIFFGCFSAALVGI